MAQVQGSREEILVSAYNEGYQYFEEYKNTTKEYYDSLKKKYEDEKLAMQILGYTPVGWLVALGQGFYNGIIGLGQGIVDKALFYAQNIKKIFQNDQDPNKPIVDSLFSGEMWNDIMYMFTAGLADDVQGIANGAVNIIGNIGNIFGNKGALTWASEAKDFIDRKANQFKATGSLTPTGAIEDAQYAKEEEAFYEDWFKKSVLGSNEFFNKLYAEDPFAPYMDNQTAYNVLSGTFQSIGRLVPSIMATSLGQEEGLTGLAKTLSASYFYATTYGQAMNEALNKGLSIQDANVYAKGSAMIETLTEQIGGFKFGEKIAGNITENFLNEALEEVISELATAGEAGETSGETLTRVAMAGISGGLSGGLLAGGNIVANRQTLGVKYQTIEDVADILNTEIKDGDIDKVQTKLRSNLDEGINQLNKIVNKPDELAKNIKTLEDTPASSFIQYNKKENKFELTKLGQQVYEDIGTKQEGKSLSKNGTYNVGIGKNVRSILSVENDAGKKVNVNINIVEKNSKIYNENKESIEKVLEMSKKTGLDVVIFEGEKVGVQGFYYSDGIAYVNANYGSDMIKQVAGHELMHAVTNLYRRGKLNLNQQKSFDKLTKDIIVAIDSDAEFKKEVLKQLKVAEDKGIVAEEALAYFIEKYVNMDEVIDKLLVSKPTLMQKIIKSITGLRKGGKISTLEQRYTSLLNQIKIKNETTLRQVLLASSYNFDNPKYSRKTLEKITIDGKIHDNEKYFIKTEKNGDAEIKLPWVDEPIIINDSDIANSEDVEDFVSSLSNGDLDGVIDNFLATTETTHIGYKYVLLQEYLANDDFLSKLSKEEMEAQKTNLQDGYVNKIFYDGKNKIKDDLFNKIDERLLEIKNKIFTGQKIYNKDLIKVDYKTFRKVLALNYLKIEERNFVSLYPEEDFKSVKEMYIRSDFNAGFLVNNNDYDFFPPSPFERGELASIFNTSKDPNKRGFVRHIADFAVNELGATNVTAISHFAYEFYHKVFQESLQLYKTEDRFYQGEYNNGIMANQWSILYSNWIVSEISKQRLESIDLSGDIVDTPVYNNIYNYITDKRFRDNRNNVITANVKEFFKNSHIRDIEERPNVAFHGTNEEFYKFLHKKGLGHSYGYGFYFTDAYEIAQKYGKNVVEAYLDIRKPLSEDEREITKEQLSRLIREIDKDGKGMLSFVGSIEDNFYEDLVENQLNLLNTYRNDADLIEKIVDLNGGYSGAEKVYKILKETLGYDGIISKFGFSDDLVYVAFNSNQIKSISNMRPTDDPDIRLSQDGMFDKPQIFSETIQEKLFNANIEEKFVKQGFIKVTDENLIKKGYVFKNSNYPLYISKEAMTFPKPYVLSNIEYYVPTGSYTFIVANTLNGEKNRINFYPDFVDEKTGKIIKNAHFLMFGSYPDKILLNVKNNIGLEQSVALEDLSKNFFSPSIFVDTNRSVYVILKNKVFGKEAYVSDLDVYSDVRVYDDKYIMFFEPSKHAKEYKEKKFELSKKVIEANKGEVTPFIEELYGVYNINGEDTPAKIRKMTVENAKKYFYKTLDFLFSDYLDKEAKGNLDKYVIPDYVDFDEKMAVLSTLKNFLISEQTTLSTFKDGLENHDYLPQVDKMFENLFYIRNWFDTHEEFIEEIKNPTSSITQSIIDYVITLPFQKVDMVREAKINVDYKQDVAYVIVQDENIDKDQQFVKDIQDNIGDGKVITIKSFEQELFTELYSRLVSKEIDPEQVLHSRKKGIESQLSKAKSEIESAKNVPAKKEAVIVKSEERVLKEKKPDEHFYTVTYDKIGKKKATTQVVKKFIHLDEAKAFARNQKNSYINRWWNEHSQDKGFGKLYFATNLVPPVSSKDVKAETKQTSEQTKVEEKLEQKADKKIEKPKIEPKVKTKPEVKKAKPTLIPAIPAEEKVEPFEINIKETLKDLNRAKNITENKKIKEKLEVRYAEKLKEYKAEKGNKLSEFLGEVVEMIESNIINQNTRERIYNHQFVDVAKYIVTMVYDLTVLEKIKPDKALVEVLIKGLNKVVANTQIYIDSIFRDNDTNILDPDNTNGYQYTKAIYWGVRDVFENPDVDFTKDERLKPLVSIYKALANLDLSNDETLIYLKTALLNFKNATNVNQTNGLALDSRGEFAHTIPNVKKQHDEWVTMMLDIVGYKVSVLNEKTGKRKNVRENGILGKNTYFDDIKVSKFITDPATFAEVTSLFMPNGAPQVIFNRIFDGSKKQLKVINVANEYFEKGGWLKANSKKIDELEKNYVDIKNLRAQVKEGEFKDASIAKSQVVSLYNTLKREIVLNMLIDEGYMRGVKTHHFDNNNFVKIADNKKDRFEREAYGISVRIADQMALLNELQEIISGDKFLFSFNEKIMGFFEEMYPFVNFRFKDINGLEMANDAQKIRDIMNEMSEDEKKEILDALPKGIDLQNIYIPYRVAGHSYMNKGAFDADNILDLGIFDGLAQSLTESSAMLLIDSINNLVPAYSREVANYYGLYRVTRDLNELFGTNKKVEGTEKQETNLAQRVSEVNPYIIDYFEKLVKDIAGYAEQKKGADKAFSKLMSSLRKNFFKASLALNFKVIATQFASFAVLGANFGTGANPFTNSRFMMNFTKNLFMLGSKTKAKYLIENSEIYKARARMSTYEIGQATDTKWNKNLLNQMTEFLMSGITMTDNMINRAFFITLRESVNPKTKQFFTDEEAKELVEIGISRHQSSSNMVTRSELLRAQNDVVKIFTKFLSEPMKILTNIYGNSKHLKIIAMFENHKGDIEKHFNDKMVAEQEGFEDYKNAIVRDDKYTQTKEFNALPKGEQQKFERKLQARKNALPMVEYDYKQKERLFKDFDSAVKEVIDGKAETKEKFFRQLTAFAGSYLWQVLIGVVFSQLLRGKWRDKPEDEEMWVYLSKMVGQQMGVEFVGYFPFLRDMYSVLMNGFSSVEIDELSALDDFVLQMRYLTIDVLNGKEFNAGRHIRQFAISLGSFLGIPARNIERLFTTPMSWISEAGTFTYKDATGQNVDVNKALVRAVKNQDEALIESIIKSKMDDRNINLGKDVMDEIERLAMNNGKAISIAGNYGSFTIDGVEYNLNAKQKEKFTEIYNKADYISAKIIQTAEYKQLNDEYKAKMITAIFNYYYRMAKQEVSGVEQISDKYYFPILADAYQYFTTTVFKRIYDAMIKAQQ